MIVIFWILGTGTFSYIDFVSFCWVFSSLIPSKTASVPLRLILFYSVGTLSLTELYTIASTAEVKHLYVTYLNHF